MVPRKKNRARTAGALIAGIAVGLGLAALLEPVELSIKPAAPIPVSSGRAATLITAYRAQNGRGAGDGQFAADERRRRLCARDGGARQDQSPDRRLTAAPRRRCRLSMGRGRGKSCLRVRLPRRGDGGMEGLLRAIAPIFSIRWSPRSAVAAYTAPPGSKHRNYWALILAAPPPERPPPPAPSAWSWCGERCAAAAASRHRADRHRQALRPGPRQQEHQPFRRQGHDPRHRRRERRRQIDADVDPLRLLPGRFRQHPDRRQADRGSTPPTRRSRPASAWCISTSCWSSRSPCSRTSCSARRAARC